jgi:hypothetical protein
MNRTGPVIIRDFPNYVIYEDGTIINTDNGRTQKITKDYKGYSRVYLRKDNILYRKYHHKLLAEAFIPNPDEYVSVIHLDGHKWNNALENLHWDSDFDFVSEEKGYVLTFTPVSDIKKIKKDRRNTKKTKTSVGSLIHDMKDLDI